MRSAITVSLVPQTLGGPFVFSQGLADAFAQAAALGFDGIEVFPPAPDAPELGALAELVRRHKLPLAAMGTGAGWVVHKLTLTHGDPAVRTAAVTFIRRIIDAAAEYGAPAIIGSMQGRWEGGVDRAQALAWLGEALAQLGEHAAGRGVPLLYEPLNRYETNLFNRLGDTAAWLHTLPTRNVRILADLFHMNIDEADSAAAIREGGTLIGHVHFADSNRRAIGFGQTQIGPIIAALREIGYGGYLSAEILPLPDPGAAAKQTIDAFRRHAADSR
jgi:sugar phosphate isomerase/epimerase